MSIDQFEGFIPLAIGAFFFTVSRGWFAKKNETNDTEAEPSPQRKIMAVLSLIVMGYGVLKIVGIAH